MAIEYTFIGWCKDEEANADKVWGMIKLTGDNWTGTYVSFWGRRGKKLQTKMHRDTYEWDVEKLVRQKEAKGYKGIEKNQLDTVYPEFQSDLEKTAFWSLLKV